MLQTVWNELDYRVDVCRITYRAPVRYVTKTWSVVLLNKKYIYSYLKCIVYDKLLKHRQSFRITLYSSGNKHLLFSYSLFTYWCLNWGRVCLLCGATWILKCSLGWPGLWNLIFKLDQMEGPRGALVLAKITGQDFENGLTQLYCYCAAVINVVLFYHETVIL